MGSISSFDALCGGPQDEFDALSDKYKPAIFSNGNLPLPHQQQNYVTTPLAQRITPFNYQNGQTDFTVDQCIVVRAPSDAFRAAKVDQWTGVKATLKNVAWLGGISSVASGAGALFAATVPFIGTAALVAAGVSVLFTGFAIHRVSQSTKQIDLWSINPAHKVAEQRQLAYERGFAFVYNNKLKMAPNSSGVLHRDEVFYLYQQYFPAYCKRLLSPTLDRHWILSFLHNNPLDPDLIKYAEAQLAGNLQFSSYDFVQLKSLLNSIQKDYSRLREDVRTKATQAINAYENKRAALLIPLIAARELYISKARSDRDAVFASTTHLETRQEAEDNFQAACNKYEMYYFLAATPINLYFDRQIRQTKEQRDANLTALSQNESAQLATYNPAAHEILSRAQYIWDQAYNYQPVQFTQFGCYVQMPPQPTFFDLPQFQPQVFAQQPNPSWNDLQQAEYAAYLNSVRAQSQGVW